MEKNVKISDKMEKCFPRPTGQECQSLREREVGSRYLVASTITVNILGMHIGRYSNSTTVKTVLSRHL